jgi:hypothetical protein
MPDILPATQILLATEHKNMSKKIINSTFKDQLLNDCTNHLSLQLKQCRGENELKHKNVNRSYETPLTDIVTDQFIRGYN